jgi:hypothetical protein
MRSRTVRLVVAGLRPRQTTADRHPDLDDEILGAPRLFQFLAKGNLGGLKFNT